mmetsp:Transcript_96271/g.299925  ORF Transcript_96271/g.299925 Transcript_96271/m.299925 type:complete len:222 (+) Transcript_96271:454-1119(+)
MRDHVALEYEATPEHDVRVVVHLQPCPTRPQHPVDGAPKQRVQALHEYAPRQTVQRAVEDACRPREQEELEDEADDRARPRLVGAPIERDHLSVGAHLEDRPEKLLEAVEGDGVDTAPREVLGEPLGPQIVQDPEVVVVRGEALPLYGGLELGVEAPEQGVVHPGRPPPVLRPRPVLHGKVVPDVGQHLLAVVGVGVDISQVPRHGPGPSLGKARHEDLDP